MEENGFENVVSEMVAILPRPQSVKRWSDKTVFRILPYVTNIDWPVRNC